MKIRHWALAAVAALATPALAQAQSADAGVTDLTKAPPGAIVASDIVEALAVPRGTRINPSAPPQVRLPIYFEFDSDRPTPEARALLEQVGAALQSSDLESFHFLVEGHTDDLPVGRSLKSLYFSNWELSAARAAAVVRYLQYGQGIDPARLEVAGLGGYRPLEPNDTPQDRQRNRRVEIVLGSPR
jgi:flagellar motor protein MotB